MLTHVRCIIIDDELKHFALFDLQEAAASEPLAPATADAAHLPTQATMLYRQDTTMGEVR